GSGLLDYQWQESPNGTSNWIPASGVGANTATFTPPSDVPGTTYYRVLITATGGGCGEALSDVAQAVILDDLEITTQPIDVNECVGGSNQMTVVASGGSGILTYQWQQSAD